MFEHIPALFYFSCVDIQKYCVSLYVFCIMCSGIVGILLCAMRCMCGTLACIYEQIPWVFFWLWKYAGVWVVKVYRFREHEKAYPNSQMGRNERLSWASVGEKLCSPSAPARIRHMTSSGSKEWMGRPLTALICQMVLVGLLHETSCPNRSHTKLKCLVWKSAIPENVTSACFDVPEINENHTFEVNNTASLVSMENTILDIHMKQAIVAL